MQMSVKMSEKGNLFIFTILKEYFLFLIRVYLKRLCRIALYVQAFG